MRLRGTSSVPILIVLAAWEVASRAGILDPVVFSSPSGILAAAVDWYASGKILPNLDQTLCEILAGGGLSFAVGVPLGIAMGWYGWISDAATPVILFLDALPIVAIAPVLPLLVGLGPWSAIVLVFMLTVLPLALNVAAGVQTTSAELLRMARHFGGRDAQLVATIVLPSVAPYIIGACRGNIGRALVGALVGEWQGSTVGLGSMMFEAAGIFEVKSVYVAALTAVAISLAASSLIGVAERRLYLWRAPR